MMRNYKLPTMDFSADLAESIEVIRANAPADGRPYYGLFSGGKDSVALKEVARMAGVPVDWHYNVTTIDPPELVHFIRNKYKDVAWLRPKHGPFWIRAAEKRGFPTRQMRWCCDEYKENKPPRGSVMLMGIRAQESPRRAATWGHVTEHHKTKTMAVNPLLYWEAEDLWDFIKSSGLDYCSLYDDGFTRLGCVGCPLGSARSRALEFERWPRYKDRWKRVIRRTWERKTGTMQRDGRRWFGDEFFDSWNELWDWWIADTGLRRDKDSYAPTD